MKTPVMKIKELVPCLPSRDIPYANKFIERRDFESLLDLVTSSIEIVERNLKKENPKEEYLSLNIEDMNSLASAVREYCILLGVFDYDEGIEDYEEEIEEEDYEY